MRLPPYTLRDEHERCRVRIAHLGIANAAPRQVDLVLRGSPQA
jgi:hypothetical protein